MHIFPYLILVPPFPPPPPPPPPPSPTMAAFATLLSKCKENFDYSPKCKDINPALLAEVETTASSVEDTTNVTGENNTTNSGDGVTDTTDVGGSSSNTTTSGNDTTNNTTNGNNTDAGGTILVTTPPMITPPKFPDPTGKYSNFDKTSPDKDLLNEMNVSNFVSPPPDSTTLHAEMTKRPMTVPEAYVTSVKVEFDEKAPTTVSSTVHASVLSYDVTTRPVSRVTRIDSGSTLSSTSSMGSAKATGTSDTTNGPTITITSTNYPGTEKIPDMTEPGGSNFKGVSKQKTNLTIRKKNLPVRSYNVYDLAKEMKTLFSSV